MTVHHAVKLTFKAERIRVATAIKTILWHNPVYKNLQIEDNIFTYDAYIQHHFWFRGTNMRVELFEYASFTLVYIETRSDKMTRIDFGLYGNYMNRFIDQMVDELGKPESISRRLEESSGISNLRAAENKSPSSQPRIGDLKQAGVFKNSVKRKQNLEY